MSPTGRVCCFIVAVEESAASFTGLAIMSHTAICPLWGEGLGFDPLKEPFCGACPQFRQPTAAAVFEWISLSTAYLDANRFQKNKLFQSIYK